MEQITLKDTLPNGKLYQCTMELLSKPNNFDIVARKYMNKVNKIRNNDDLLSIIIPTIRKNWFFNIDFDNIVIAKITFEDDIKNAKITFVNRLHNSIIKEEYHGMLYHISTLKYLDNLIYTYGGLRHGYMYPTPRIYASIRPTMKNGWSMLIDDLGERLDMLEKQDFDNINNKSCLWCIKNACESTIYEFKYKGEVLKDNEQINDNTAYYIESSKKIHVDRSSLNNYKISFEYLQNNYPNIYSYISNMKSSSYKPRIYKNNKVKTNINWSSLIKRLEMINFAKDTNFSKPIDLTYRGIIYEYKSEKQAIERLYAELGGEFSEHFIRQMIESGHLDINEWKDYYDPSDEYDYSNEKEMQEVVGNKHIIKMLLNAKHLTRQNDIYGHEFIFYNPLCNKTYVDSLSAEEYNGICTITSIYNAQPDLFNYSKTEIVETVKNLGHARFDNLEEVIKYINNKFPKIGKDSKKSILTSHFLNTSGELENWIKRLSNENTPIILTVNSYKNIQIAKKNKSNIQVIGHTINVLGYDKYNYIIYDNVYNNITKKYMIELLILKYLENIIRDDYKNKNYDIDFLNKKYAKIGLKHCDQLVDRYMLRESIASKFIHQNNIIKINKRLFNYAFDTMNIIYLTRGYNMSYTRYIIDQDYMMEKIWNTIGSKQDYEYKSPKETFKERMRISQINK